MKKVVNLPDEELLILLHTGSHDAFNEVYNRYWNKLYFIALKHLQETAEAEEVVQEVFVALWSKRQVLKIDALPAYLAAMTRYAVFARIQRQKKTPVTSLDKVAPDNLRQVLEEGSFENKILLEIVSKLANHLPEKCRLVFVHNKLLDQPLPQVAEELGISIKTAEAHLTKALKTIRTKLGDTPLTIFL